MKWWTKFSEKISSFFTIDFNFLEDGKTYKALLYRDADDAHFKENPEALVIENMELTKGDSKSFVLAPGGGFAISLMPK